MQSPPARTIDWIPVPASRSPHPEFRELEGSGHLATPVTLRRASTTCFSFGFHGPDRSPRSGGLVLEAGGVARHY